MCFTSLILIKSLAVCEVNGCRVEWLDRLALGYVPRSTVRWYTHIGGWSSRNQIEIYIPTVRIPNMGLMTINHILYYFLTMAHIVQLHQPQNMQSRGSIWSTKWEHFPSEIPYQRNQRHAGSIQDRWDLQSDFWAEGDVVVIPTGLASCCNRFNRCS